MGGAIPLLVVADGHGCVNLTLSDPATVPAPLRNVVHVGGRQVVLTTPFEHTSGFDHTV